MRDRKSWARWLTGLNMLWYAVAAFTLISAGFALMRLVPRRRG